MYAYLWECKETIYRIYGLYTVTMAGYTTPAWLGCSSGPPRRGSVPVGLARTLPREWSGGGCSLDPGAPRDPPGAPEESGAALPGGLRAEVPEGRAGPAHPPALPAAGSARGRRGRGAAARPRLPAAGRQHRRSRSAPGAAPQLSDKHRPLVLVPPPAAGKRRAPVPGRASGGPAGSPTRSPRAAASAPSAAHMAAGNFGRRASGRAGGKPGVAAGVWEGSGGRKERRRGRAGGILCGAVRSAVRGRRRGTGGGRRAGVGRRGLRVCGREQQPRSARCGAARAGPVAGQRRPGGGTPGGRLLVWAFRLAALAGWGE